MENNKPAKRALFIDRDGTLVVEPPVDYQLDSFEKMEFVPGVIRNLAFIAEKLDYELVMVTNQDGLGTDSFPTETFVGPHELMLKTFAGEGITFDDIVIDVTFEHENKPTRKPGTALLGKYTSGDYDLAGSYVIGDRLTDMQLAHNLGAKGILLTADAIKAEADIAAAALADDVALVATSWSRIADYLRGGSRTAHISRVTNETSIHVQIDLDGTGRCEKSTNIDNIDKIHEQ